MSTLIITLQAYHSCLIFKRKAFTAVGRCIPTEKVASLGGLQAVVKKGFTERRQSQTWQYNNVIVSVWQDTKPIVVAATNSDPLTSTTVTRKQRDGTRVKTQPWLVSMIACI